MIKNTLNNNFVGNKTCNETKNKYLLVYKYCLFYEGHMDRLI